ncbi:thrombopoietin receptor isoform X2 [Sardina pilchardus]|uniref:thrombopoietin receptor isoform X2 n=1 Tax=Sardina pilchardus TaxID=27697 RepID=UPI002E15B6A0
MLIWMVFVCLQTSCILAQHIGSYVQVSEKELQLLASENDPKCFTRTDYDFTCFWEARSGHSYIFSYVDEDSESKSQCNLTQRTTSRGTVLHICSFPPSHVFLYIPIAITVVDALTNTTVFQREVNIEETELPYPPKNISVEKTGKAEELLVRWKEEEGRTKSQEQFEIRYSSQTQPERRTVVDRPVRLPNAVLTSLVSGEVCCVQMRVKSRRKGFWSDWTEPVMAMVPEKAEDTGFLCYTSDLRTIQCQWNKQAQNNGSINDEEVTIFYREKNSTWGNWTLCTKNHRSTPSCSFDGQSGAIQVSLHTGSGPLNRTFYTEEFTVNNRIKTEPPTALRAEPERERLHLQWDCPSEILAKHLIYEIRYRSEDENAWKHFVWKSPKTSTYLHEQASSQYFIQIKSKPNGSFYKGDWSDWSSMLTVEESWNYGLVFIACIPLAILLLSAVVASVFSQYFSKVKRYLWPPVPRLDKILESFLAEGPQWEPTFSIKQCDDETPASVVEILSDNPTSSDTIQGITVCTSGLETGSYSRVPQKEEGGPVVEGCLEAGRDYVTLTTEVIPCLHGNEYVYGDISVSCSAEVQCHCTNTQIHTSPVSGLTATSIFNHSYQLLPEREDGCENENLTHYTNLDAAVTGTA